jgi:hypothetical protein
VLGNGILDQAIENFEDAGTENQDTTALFFLNKIC